MQMLKTDDVKNQWVSSYTSANSWKTCNHSQRVREDTRGNPATDNVKNQWVPSYTSVNS